MTVGFLSARSSAATAHRAAQLGITLVHQGVASKLETYDQIVSTLKLDDSEIAYMGDDILDLRSSPALAWRPRRRTPPTTCAREQPGSMERSRRDKRSEPDP